MDRRTQAGPITRRGFMAAAAGSSLAMAGRPAAAVEPIQRTGEPRLKLSLVGYSMRKYLQADPDSEGAMDLFGFVDWASELGFDAVELTGYYFPESFDAEFAHNLKRHCHLQGMDISGGAIGNNVAHNPGEELDREFASIERFTEAYGQLGAPVMRVFGGNPPGGVDREQATENIIRNLKRMGEIGAKHGVMMGLENHDLLVDPDRLARVLDAVDSPWVGMTLDSANWDAADPYAAFERFAPYAANVQIKTMLHPRGESEQEADLGRLLGILRDSGYRGYVGLEYEEAEDPYEAIPRIHEALRSAL